MAAKKKIIWKKDKKEQDFWRSSDGRYIRIYGDEIIIGPDEYGDAKYLNKYIGSNYSLLKKLSLKFQKLNMEQWNKLLV